MRSSLFHTVCVQALLLAPLPTLAGQIYPPAPPVSASGSSALTSALIAAAGGVVSGSDVTTSLMVKPSGASSPETLGAYMAAVQVGYLPMSALGSTVPQLVNGMVLSSQLPFGNGTGQIPDAAIAAAALTAETQRATGVEANKLGIGADASTNTVTVAGETSGRQLAVRAADVYNLADHGADGTAVNDSAALTKAIAYATARSGTTIYLPHNINGQPWAFLATPGPNTTPGSPWAFALPSNTEFAGAGEFATTITWNDTNVGYGSGNQYWFMGSTGTASSPATNISVRDFTLQGTWSLSTTAKPAGDFTPGVSPFGFINVNGMRWHNVGSRYSRGFGLNTGNSINVSYDDVDVNYAYADGIHNDGVSNLLIHGFRVAHVNDDCVSGHNATGEVGNVRRDVVVGEGSCFDTQAVDFAGIRHGVFSSIHFESPKGNALAFDTAAGGNGATEGNSAISGLVVDGISINNLINRNALDNFNGADTAITLDGNNARLGSYTAVPGVSTTGVTSIRDPYPEWMANSNAVSTAVAAGARIRFSNIDITRDLPASNNTDTRFPNWASFGGGPVATVTGELNPTFNEAAMRGDCMDISGGDLQDVQINAFHCSGMGNGIYLINSGNGVFDDISVSNSSFYDMGQFAIGMNFTGNSKGMIEVTNTTFDMDPYDKQTNRGGSGNWNSLSNTLSNGLPGCTAVAFCQIGTSGSLFAMGNRVKNAAEDTNVDTTSTSTGWEFRDDYDYAQIGVPYAFSQSQNFGIGFVHPGFNIVPMDSVPGDAAYGTITSDKPSDAPAMPTAGTWHQGDYVRNTAPTASTPVIRGWLRITNGTGSTAGTDWIVDHAQ